MDDSAEGLDSDAPAVLEEGDIVHAELVDEDDIVGGPVHVMYERLAQDDYDGAMLVAEGILEHDPAHRDALQCLAICDGPLRKLYVSRVGSLDRIPQLSRGSELFAQRVADPRAHRLLELVDGLTSLSRVVDGCGLVTTEALRIASELYLLQIIEFEDE
jgi:hypothetical protein